ncbi:MAG: insulinase family protein [Holosporaceae bacterium]|nr:insulinase family protein [Holosporaceae bacterium]
MNKFWPCISHCLLIFYVAYAAPARTSAGARKISGASAKAQAASAKIVETSATQKVRRLVTKAGVRFWFMRDDSAPLVHVKIAFKNSGASRLEKSKAGLPQLYANTVFCGSGKCGEMEFRKKCSDISISISCKAEIDRMVFSMTSPKIVLDEAIGLFREALASPVFEKDKVTKIQNELAYSLQNYAANPVGVAFGILIPPVIFQSHPYENGDYGRAEDFLKLSTEDLREYGAKFLVTANAEACVFGDVTEKESISLLDKVFSGIKAGRRAPDNLRDVTPMLISAIGRYYADGPQSTIVFVLKNEKQSSPKRAAAVILHRILGGNGLFRSRLMSELRTKLGLIYGEFMVPVDLNHANYIFGMLQTDNSKTTLAVQALKKVIGNMRKKGITEKELEFAKNNIKGTLLVGLRTSRDLCQFYFEKMLNGLGPKALSDFLEKIERVTLAEVNQLARELLDEDHLSLIIIGGGQ